MNVARALKTLAGRRPGEQDLAESEACELFSVMLDGGLGELELGAMLGVLAMKRPAATELAGLRRALQARLHRLASPTDVRPIVIPSYGGARAQVNLMPLLALMLARFGAPVLVHGSLEAQGGVAGATVLRELGVPPCTSLPEARAALETSRLAFVPTALLSPSLAQLLALRARLGIRNCAHRVARLLDPFAGDGLKLVPADDDWEATVFAEVLSAQQEHALLFLATEGEAYADPQRRPAIAHLRGGEQCTLFEAAPAAAHGAAHPLLGSDRAEAKFSARWIRLAFASKVPLPPPLSNLLACCLYACGLSADLHQAKALVAVRAGACTAP